MPSQRTILWSDLPHHARIGWGREGLILLVEERECIKLYSPTRQEAAHKEFSMLERMLMAQIKVPRPREVVTVSIPEGTSVQLPDRDDFYGIGLYDFDDISSTVGLIKEYIPGKHYGSFYPTPLTLHQLLSYLVDTYNGGFVFIDHQPSNFIFSPHGVYGIDVSLVEARQDIGNQRFSKHKGEIRNVFTKLQSICYEKGGLHSILFDFSLWKLKRSSPHTDFLL